MATKTKSPAETGTGIDQIDDALDFSAGKRYEGLLDDLRSRVGGAQLAAEIDSVVADRLAQASSMYSGPSCYSLACGCSCEWYTPEREDDHDWLLDMDLEVAIEMVERALTSPDCQDRDDLVPGHAMADFVRCHNWLNPVRIARLARILDDVWTAAARR